MRGAKVRVWRRSRGSENTIGLLARKLPTRIPEVFRQPCRSRAYLFDALVRAAARRPIWHRRTDMRFMMVVIHPEGTSPPTDAELFADELAKMGRYNEELMKAGVLLALDGLHPQSAAVRVTFD